MRVPLREDVYARPAISSGRNWVAREIVPPAGCRQHRPRLRVASQLREGMALRIDGQIYKVLESEFKAGGGQAGTRSRITTVRSGSSRMRSNNRWHSSINDARGLRFISREEGKGDVFVHFSAIQ